MGGGGGAGFHRSQKRKVWGMRMGDKSGMMQLADEVIR